MPLPKNLTGDSPMPDENNYTGAELMAATVASEIKDRHIVFVGIGLPLIAGLLAKLTHAPYATLVFETGCIGPEPLRMPWFIDDNACHDRAFCITSLWRVFSDLQRGYYDLGILGAAQIDRYGNINSTMIGDYNQPQVRLPGSGGGNDIGSSANSTIIMAKLEKKRFVSKLDYMTTPGHLNGGESRRKAGLTGGGPISVITDKCTFKFDNSSKEMTLDRIYPNATVDDVKREVSWNLKLSSRILNVEPPTQEQLVLIKTLDTSGFILGESLTTTDFESWASSVEHMIETLTPLYQK